MPCIEDIIGLPGFQIQNVQKDRVIEVSGVYLDRPACAHCGAKGCRIKSSFWRRLKHSRQGNMLIELLVRSHKYLCLVCRRYFNLRIPGVLPRRRATENFRLEVYEKHHGGMTQRLLSKIHKIGEATVERWYQDFVGKRVKEMSDRPSARILGIDEHFFTRKDGYATTLVDLRNHKVHDVILGRSESSLNAPLQRIPERHRTRAVVMDLSDTYRSIVKKHFPNAVIVADRFHVIRLVNHHFLQTWKQLDPIGRKNRGLLSLMRMHEQNLELDKREKLQLYLKARPILAEVYAFKQKLIKILLLRKQKKHQLRPHIHALVEMVNQLKETSLESLKTLGHTLERWIEEIGRMLRFSYSNGITEGFHNKMEMISRRAFGFRKFTNYRLRVLAHCGWDGVFAIRN